MRIFDDGDAIDDNGLDSVGVLVWIFEGGPVDDRLRIENDDVSKIPFLKVSPASQSKSLGCMTAQLADCLFETEQLVVSHTGTEQSRRRTVHARVDEAVREVDAIAAHHVAVVAEERMNEIVCAVVVDAQYGELLLDEQVADGVLRGLPDKIDVLRERFPQVNGVFLAR